MRENSTPHNEQAQEQAASSIPGWLSKLSWGFAVVMSALMIFLLLRRTQVIIAQSNNTQTATEISVIPENSEISAPLPAFSPVEKVNGLSRQINTHTIIPSRSRDEVVDYTVRKGDAIFGIANKYKLKPETVLWANYDQLNDNPDMISVGLTLKIPAVDGVYHQWEEDDTVESVASNYDAEVTDILNWPGNKLDLTNPEIEPGAYVMVPGGHREFRQWLVPTIWRSGAGASKTIAGPGSCTLPEGGAFGTGSFIWPTVNHYLSGNDYWPGHLGIDLAAASGAPIYATDNGLVVYAGSIGGGYGLMIMIDHGNGYHTLYAHLSKISVYCGQSVNKGNLIGLSGSTGNSTGPHLHFEVRYQGGFVNPWYVLP